MQYYQSMNQERYQIFRNRNQNFVSETKFSETETDTFFPRPNFPKPKPRLFSETIFFETDTETLQKLAKVSRPRPKLFNILANFWSYLLQIFSSFSFSSLFLFSSPPEKKIFSFPEYFPPFSSPFFFSSNVNVNVNVNVAVFAFLHLIDRSKTKKDHNSNKRFALVTWSSVFLVILLFSFPKSSFPR